MSGRLRRLRALRPRLQQVKPGVTHKIAVGTKNDEEKVTMSAFAIEETVEGSRIFKLDTETDNNQTIVETETNDIKLCESMQSYECKMCKPSKFLPNVEAYLEHTKKDHKQKGKHVYEGGGNRCPMCSYIALTLRDLETHQRVHHLKRRFFRCAKCSYVTHVRARYTKHVKYHSMPMIKCDTCDFRTPYKWNLDRHTRNHGGGGAFQCRVCNFTADIRQSLTVHETNHHEPPVGQVNRKANIAFERKSRNSPKRYNQVGASDYRELNTSTNPATVTSDIDSSIILPSLDRAMNNANEKQNAIASAECIALKCEEKGCQFITAWDSEMQRHLAECHIPITHSKSRKPLPMLIPLSPVSNTSGSSFNNSTTLLRVPRVRVRPELAQIARDTELAKLYGKELTNIKKDNNTADLFEKKNASFFDKLKEKLTTAITSGLPEVAVTSIDDLKCWCTFKAATIEDLACHKQTHHTALSVSIGTSRCPRCRRRCKSSADLQVHMQCCQPSTKHSSMNSNMDKSTNSSDFRMMSYHSDCVLPAEVDWDISLGGITSSASSVEQSWDDPNMEEQIIGESNIMDEPPNKLLIMNKKEYSQPPGLTAAPGSILTQTNRNHTVNTLSVRPPPPLKAAVRGSGQSLLKCNPVSANGNNAFVCASISATPSSLDENKRTLWKCKRCNYRDSSKETVLLHVKSHYESLDQSSNERKNAFGCGDCPFSTSDAASLSVHRMHHRPNLEAIFKCYLCPYYVSTKAELLEHARLHGEELAVVHQQSVDFHSPLSKSKLPTLSTPDDNNDGKEDPLQISQIVSQNNSILSTSSGVGGPPPLLLDTRALPEPPLVWVSRPDGTLTKMLKCRHCPHVSTRRAEVIDHETMHIDTPSQGPFIACTDCSFTCNRKEVMIVHSDMHSGSLGTVHCLVDETRSDTQQVSDLATLLGFKHQPVLGSEPDLRDLRLVHCCGKCPARFLCEKELRIHLRYHSTELAYSCQWCSYAARQQAHLLAHQKAHSSEYQERTKYLLSLYSHSQRYPPPTTACVEANNQCNNASSSAAWIVVELTGNSAQAFNNTPSNTSQKSGNQVFTCAKCPARYFRLDALEYHMTLHGSNNRFKCNECDYSSKTAQNLVKHQVVHRRHTEIKEYTSPEPSPDPQFGVFMRGNPNFVYPGYVRNGRLKEKRYKCHKCPSAFEKREQYRVHLTLHGAKQRYRCGTCDYSVKYYANYIQHLKKHQANAEAQASRRQFEDDTISVETDNIADYTISISRPGKSLRAPPVVGSLSSAADDTCTPMGNFSTTTQSSNQDKQSVMMMQKKGILLTACELETETVRCQSCPFSTTDKETMDSHKRRHGIERMTPSCPHCDYIPRKDENIGEHIRLHFTRLYRPESYLIIELLTLTMTKVLSNEQKGKQKPSELLFKECADGKFFPPTDATSLSLTASPTVNACSEKVIIDPNTGEAKHHLAV